MRAEYEMDSLPALDMDIGQTKEILTQVGLLAGGAVVGAVARDKLIKQFLKDDLYAALAELGLGVIGAGALMKTGNEMFFWPLVGVAVHAGADLLVVGLDKLGLSLASGEGSGSVLV